jgi:hypothetical protein
MTERSQIPPMIVPTSQAIQNGKPRKPAPAVKRRNPRKRNQDLGRPRPLQRDRIAGRYRASPNPSAQIEAIDMALPTWS